MAARLIKNITLPLLYYIFYLCFITGFVFSFRVLSSISIGLIFLTNIITNKSFLASLFQKKAETFFIAGCVLCFLLQVISLAYTQNQQEGWIHIRLKSGLVITPLAVYCSGYINKATGKKLLFYFCIILAIASLYCLIATLFRYVQSGNSSLFFYHQLVSPLEQHAVYFSLFVFMAIVYLLESLREEINHTRKQYYIAFTIYFSIFLFLLSSKLVIAFFLIYLLYYFITVFKRNRQQLISVGLLFIVLLSGAVVLTTNNPIGNRFSELLKGNIAQVGQVQYTPADYFNGLQFRVLQWKLVPEILNENKAWLTGVGAGDAQDYLDRKYISKNMYTGDIQRNDHGFLGYNTHNQFLQSLLETGIMGLLVFLFTCFFLLKMLLQKKQAEAAFIISLLLVYSFIESVFETQYGIIIFTFLPLFIYLSDFGQSKKAVSSY